MEKPFLWSTLSIPILHSCYGVTFFVWKPTLIKFQNYAGSNNFLPPGYDIIHFGVKPHNSIFRFFPKGLIQLDIVNSY